MTVTYTYPRYSLEADCVASGLEVPSDLIACSCGRLQNADSLFDARDYDDLSGDWVCSTCFSDIDRREAMEAEVAARPAPSWSAECEIGNAVRAERRERFMASDWTQGPYTPLSSEQVIAWADYRQALRDLPTTFETPDLVVWPVSP